MVGLPRGSHMHILQRGIRFSSTNALATKSLAKMLVIPLTQDKSYLYFKYNRDILMNNNSPLVRYEEKAVNLATKGWNKLRDSDKSYNKKIVHYVTKFLEQTPWTEDSLRSIPSKSAMLRQVRNTTRSTEKPDVESPVSIKATEEIDHETEKLINIPVYYPSSILTPSSLNAEIAKLSKDGEAYHRRFMILTGIGIPLSLPFALVPVVPNIPGFYLAYRFYCNFKAMLGSKHLAEMQTGDELLLKEDSQLDLIYESSVKEMSGKADELLLDEDIIDRVVETYEIPEARASLIKALRQERKRLEKMEEESNQKN